MINPEFICVPLLFPNSDVLQQQNMALCFHRAFLMRKHFVGNVINFGHSGESAECVFSADSETISSFRVLCTKDNSVSLSLVVNHVS